MRRRDFLALSGAATAAWPLAAQSQQARLPRVALASPIVPLSDISETGTNGGWRAFFTELRRLGLIESQNVIFERYSALGVIDLEQLGRAIASTQPDLIVAGASTAIAQGAMRAAPNIPIVFLVGDALASGLVSSLSRPGGNLTGANATGGVETEGKRIELLRETIPHAMRVGYLDAQVAYEPLGHRPVVELAASRLGLMLIPEIVDRPFDEAGFKGAFDNLARREAQMLVLANTTNITGSAAIIAPLAKAARLATCAAVVSWVDAGGLMSYGADQIAPWTAVAAYVDQILNGAHPGDLPVQQPSKFELVVNLKAAAELGIEIPPSLLLQATDVRN